MVTTRSEPGPEGRAALGHALRALLPLGGVIAIGVFHDDLEQLGIEAGMSADQSTQIITTVTLIALVAFAILTLAALWRTARWFRELRYERMLRDPRRAARVPPLASHLSVLQRVPTAGVAVRKGLWFAFLIATVIAGLLLLPERENSTGNEDDGSTALHALVLGGLLVAALVYAAYHLRRWLRARRAERMASDPDLGAGTAPELSNERAATIPPLRVSFDDESHAGYRGLFPVTRERNVFGRPPWKIAYLRLFDNEARAHEFLDGAWRECGYVYLIRGASTVSGDELDAAGDGRPTFIDSVEWLHSTMSSMPSEPLPVGRHEITTIAGSTVAVDDPYGSYPLRALLCHTTFWKSALDALLAIVDVVVLDLSGFVLANAGTGYELQRVIDRFRSIVV